MGADGLMAIERQEQMSNRGWAEAYARWANNRLDRRLRDVPSWRLLQELKQRGDLVPAEDADLGQTKGGTGKLRIGAHPVDRHGLPLYRVVIEED